MGMSEGILKLDDAWALIEEKGSARLPAVPVAKRKAKAVISK